MDDDDFDFEEEDDDDFDKGRLRVLENEYHTFMAIGEALQAYYNGIKTLYKAESMIEDHEKTNQLFGSLDFFRRAMVLVEGRCSIFSHFHFSRKRKNLRQFFVEKEKNPTQKNCQNCICLNQFC